MNITFFTVDMGKGGAQRVISVLSNYLCDNGHNISILLTDNVKDIAYELDNRINVAFYDEWRNTYDTVLLNIRTFIYKLKVRLCRKKADIFEEKLNFQKQSDYLVRYLKRYPTDMVIGFTVKPNIIAGLASRRIHAKIIMAERNYPNRPFEEHFKKLRNSCYKKANVLVFQTKEQAEMFPKSIQRKSIVIPNPVKEDLPSPYIGERNKVIVNFCGYKTHKNISLLIDAYSMVEKRHPEYTLKVYGYGPQKEVLQQKIEDLGLQEKVELLPFESNIHERVLKDAMFVMSSDFEGMPNALIEAMAMGMPVISTDCLGGGARAVIENGVNGILVTVGDKYSLAEAINDLIEHPNKAINMAEKAKNIKDTLSADKIAKLWLTNILI